MPKRWDKPWDGKPYKSGWQQARGAWREAKEATARKEADPDLMARRQARQERSKAKQARRARKRGQFDLTVRFDEDGVPHCVRCDHTEFKRVRKRNWFAWYSILTLTWWKVLLGLRGEPGFMCRRCGAFYPRE